MVSSTRAELSSITSQAEELMNRIIKIGDDFRQNPESQFVSECNTAERNLMNAIRALERSKKHLS